MKRILLIIFIALPLTLKAQHGISPGYAFLDEKNKQISLTIFNQGDEEKEAEIALKFGYPVYEDSLGGTVMNYSDSVLALTYSLNERVRVFPRKVIVPGRSQQLVKFIFTGSIDDLPIGTSWSRISVISKIKMEQIEQSEVEGVAIGFQVNFETSSLLMFQKGNLTTGLELGDIEIREDSLNYYFIVDTKKTGNSPYVGMYEMNIKDAGGKLLNPVSGSYVIYFDAKPGLRVPKSDLPDGKYTASLHIHNERPDFDKERLIKTEPIIKDFDFTITGNDFKTEE